jgi:acetyltransferase-like isoleucine patch superfamily enzyme
MPNLARHLQHVADTLRCKVNPIKYARSIGVKLGENVTFYGASPGMFSTEPWLISIGNDVHITNGVRFLTHDGGTLIVQDEVHGFVLTGDIAVGDNTYIGIDTVILPGVSIGSNCIIGARSVVTKDIPDGIVAAGVPARAISTKEKYTDKVRDVMAGNNSRYYSDLEYMHSLNPNRKP